MHETSHEQHSNIKYTMNLYEKLLQHQLRWFGHIQQRPPEAPVNSGIKRVWKTLGGAEDDQSGHGQRR
jgi:hypothetical protein